MARMRFPFCFRSTLDAVVDSESYWRARALHAEAAHVGAKARIADLENRLILKAIQKPAKRRPKGQER